MQRSGGAPAAGSQLLLDPRRSCACFLSVARRPVAWAADTASFGPPVAATFSPNQPSRPGDGGRRRSGEHSGAHNTRQRAHRDEGGRPSSRRGREGGAAAVSHVRSADGSRCEQASGRVGVRPPEQTRSGAAVWGKLGALSALCRERGAEQRRTAERISPAISHASALRALRNPAPS